MFKQCSPSCCFFSDYLGSPKNPNSPLPLSPLATFSVGIKQSSPQSRLLSPPASLFSRPGAGSARPRTANSRLEADNYSPQNDLSPFTRTIPTAHTQSHEWAGQRLPFGSVSISLSHFDSPFSYVSLLSLGSQCLSASLSHVRFFTLLNQTH